MMALSQQKEQFSNAYLRAVVAVAGYTLAKPEVDDDSTDWCLFARSTVDLPRRPRLELQLKCTARNIMRKTHLHFPLEIKNYDDLRDPNVLVPRILIVVLVPDLPGDWITQSEDEMVLRHCGYWLSLRGAPAVANTESLVVRLPRRQQFTPDALHQIMQRINERGTL